MTRTEACLSQACLSQVCLRQIRACSNLGPAALLQLPQLDGFDPYENQVFTSVASSTDAVAHLSGRNRFGLVLESISLDRQKGRDFSSEHPLAQD